MLRYWKIDRLRAAIRKNVAFWTEGKREYLFWFMNWLTFHFSFGVAFYYTDKSFYCTKSKLIMNAVKGYHDPEHVKNHVVRLFRAICPFPSAIFRVQTRRSKKRSELLNWVVIYVYWSEWLESGKRNQHLSNQTYITSLRKWNVPINSSNKFMRQRNAHK